VICLKFLQERNAGSTAELESRVCLEAMDELASAARAFAEEKITSDELWEIRRRVAKRVTEFAKQVDSPQARRFLENYRKGDLDEQS